MSDAPSSTPSWREDIARDWIRTRLAGEALQVAKDAADHQFVSELARRAMGRVQDGSDNTQGDPMGNVSLSIGDTIYQAPPAQGSASTPSMGSDASTASTVPQAVKGGMGTLAKTLVGAALLASGAGAGAGVPWLLSALRGTAQQVEAPQQGQGQVDTLNDLEIGGGAGP